MLLGVLGSLSQNIMLEFYIRLENTWKHLIARLSLVAKFILGEKTSDNFGLPKYSGMIPPLLRLYLKCSLFVLSQKCTRISRHVTCYTWNKGPPSHAKARNCFWTVHCRSFGPVWQGSGCGDFTHWANCLLLIMAKHSSLTTL